MQMPVGMIDESMQKTKTGGSAAWRKWADLCGARQRDLILATADAPCSLRNESFPFPGEHSAPGDLDAPQVLQVIQLLI